MTKKMIITGSTSKIIQEFIPLIDGNDVDVITCGRKTGNDKKFDFSKHEDCMKFILFLKKEKPNYLFINHGILPGKKLCDYKKSEIVNTLYCNQISQLYILESLVSHEDLSTLVTSSISGKLGSFDTLYASTKAAVDLSVNVFSKKIPKTSRLNAISPGIISDARMTTTRKDLTVLKKKLEETPTKAFTTSLEVAMLAYYIFFESKNLNGQNINVNGGIV